MKKITNVFNDQMKYMVYGTMVAGGAMLAIKAIPFTNIVFTIATGLFAILALLTVSMLMYSRKLAVKKA